MTSSTPHGYQEGALSAEAAKVHNYVLTILGGKDEFKSRLVGKLKNVQQTDMLSDEFIGELCGFGKEQPSGWKDVELMNGHAFAQAASVLDIALTDTEIMSQEQYEGIVSYVNSHAQVVAVPKLIPDVAVGGDIDTLRKQTEALNSISIVFWLFRYLK